MKLNKKLAITISLKDKLTKREIGINNETLVIK